jgi:zinc D-Ala-D-Ala carboxypeptidase
MCRAARRAYREAMAARARSGAHRPRSTILAALAVVSVAVVSLLVYQSPASSTSTVEAPTGVPDSDHDGAPGEAGGLVPTNTAVPRSEQRAALGEADGVVPDGTTVFDDQIPGVAKLDPNLLDALRKAATDAAHDGVEFFVDSGWRSPAYQEQLLRQAISTYGSDKEAARWVSTPATSAHVRGDAVDLGHADARAWLAKHGAGYGLCQIYRNEPWHYELRPQAIDHGCPPMYADSAHDPRT